MIRPTVLIYLSILLLATGLIVVAAYYALVPGYETLYVCLLTVALVLGILAYRSTANPELRGPAGAIFAVCVIYWTLGGATLPEWATEAALLLTPITTAGAVITLCRRGCIQPANGS